MTLDPAILAALASQPDALAAYVTAMAATEQPAAAAQPAAATPQPAAATEQPAASQRDWSGYSPSDEKRATLATGAILYALNHAGLLTTRKRAGSPLLHGACFDIRNDTANVTLSWPQPRAAAGRKGRS